MIASAGKSIELCQSVGAHVGQLRSVEGFEGAVLLRDVDQPNHLLVVLRWASKEVFVARGEALDKEAFASMPLVLNPPPGAYLEYVTV